MNRTEGLPSSKERSKKWASVLYLLAFSQINKQDAQGSATNTLYSFEPEIISESEERERITALAQRDFLIKSYGMLEQIYMAMKKNGTLRPADERKYGLYGRLGQHANTNDSTCSSSAHQRRHCHQNNCTHATQLTTDQCIQCSLKGNNVIIFLWTKIYSLKNRIKIQI